MFQRIPYGIGYLFQINRKTPTEFTLCPVESTGRGLSQNCIKDETDMGYVWILPAMRR